MNLLDGVAITAAGFAAGGVNTIVGSGSLVTFPTLLAVGYPSVTANVSNTVGLVFGGVSGVYGYREELKGQRNRALKLACGTTTGALLGGVLLLTLPSSVFDAIVPALILLACVLMAIPRTPGGHAATDRTGAGIASAFLTGIYGGYFGAAQGIILMSLLRFCFADDLQRLNGLKNVLAATANGVAAVLFIIVADVRWAPAALIAVGSTAGAQVAARYGRRIPPQMLRWIVVIGGTIVAMILIFSKPLTSRDLMPEQYDVIVIGSGPGGYVAAIRSAQLGMKTAVVEKDKVGGRCLNYACIPAKAVLRVADVLAEIDEADEFGIEVPERSVDYSKVSARREKVIKTLTGGVSGLFKKNQIDVIEGVGSLAGDGQVKVGDEIYTASKGILLATGSVARPVPGTTFGGRVIGTEEAWALRSCRRRSRCSAPARRARRSRPPTAGSAPRCSCSRRSTACCRPRTPTSPRLPGAPSPSRTSRSTPARWSRTSRPTTARSPSPMATRPARPSGW